MCENLCVASLLELPTMFADSFQVIPIASFVSDFNWLSCESDNFTFRLLDCVSFYQYYIKMFYNTITVPCKKSKIFSFTTSKMKNIVFPPHQDFL